MAGQGNLSDPDEKHSESAAPAALFFMAAPAGITIATNSPNRYNHRTRHPYAHNEPEIIPIYK
ncbi:hypothetical protein CHELA40_13224 [Chelatococcus asaccharovorans]|nr:hypothetical protein CHELA40_13224 [Chelatococcus asaccharovorans]CAH1679521.1 hypothetical protein CHELA17_62396 [Chelatococcus asaccharovorans]